MKKIAEFTGDNGTTQVVRHESDKETSLIEFALQVSTLGLLDFSGNPTYEVTDEDGHVKNFTSKHSAESYAEKLANK